ncbi:histidine kinase N-terminal 7TM domain-containing protein [Halovivax cerinus]|uniref:histidine kinase n=1 Tax=Halovivax cerinus TaxID=1487865 RepID=A0ABD5NPS5_9EURY|nr:histidine kinase N-terminal 7TM domain-containing protein [Halovivax cerinus]
MSVQFSPVHAGTLVLVGLLNLGLGALLVRTRSDRSVPALFVFLFGVSLWTIPQGILLIATDRAISFGLVVSINVGASIMSVGLFHFGLSYSGRTAWLRWRRIGLCYLSILFWAVLFVTNPSHELVYVSRSYAGELLPIISDQHALYWVYVFYNWSFSGLGAYLLFLEYLDVRGDGVYEKQAALVVLAPVIPFVANVFAFSGATAVNYTVWGFGATGVLIATAIYQYRWLDLIPIGRDQVIEGMRDGYLVVDEDGRIADANRSAVALLADDDPVGKGIGQVLPECRALLDGEATERQFALDGAIVDATVSTLTTRRGAGSVVMLRDVTDERRAERRFRALIENVSDVITVVDATGTITYQSPAVEDALGYDPDELVGTAVIDVVHPEDRDDARRTVAELLDRPGEMARFEYRLRTADGSSRVFDGVLTNLLENDFVDGIVITFRDVTSRKRREEQLVTQNEYLDEFAEIVSHDLQGPLMSIKGNADLALSTGSVEHVTHVLDAVDRTNQLVDDLLQIARTGRRIEELEPVALGDLSRSAWGRVWSPDAELVVETEQTILADPDRVRQLLGNLFGNAVEHGSTDGRADHSRNTLARSGGDRQSTATEPERGVTVAIGSLPLGFYVEDDGPGIPPDERDRIFDRGFTTSDDGLGLGLGIVKQIVGAHGWSIRVTEGSDGGARFEISGVELAD